MGDPEQRKINMEKLSSEDSANGHAAAFKNFELTGDGNTKISHEVLEQVTAGQALPLTGGAKIHRLGRVFGVDCSTTLGRVFSDAGCIQR